MAKRKYHNLDALVSDKELEKAKESGRKAKEQYDEIEHRRQNDPDFEDWYAKECQKTENELKNVTIQKTFKELNEIYKHCRGL